MRIAGADTRGRSLACASPGQGVYDPFVGSGTTIIAGEMTGRCVHALELNPAYVDVAVMRWQSFTGKTAVLEATGESFEATGAGRSAAAEPRRS